MFAAVKITNGSPLSCAMTIESGFEYPMSSEPETIAAPIAEPLIIGDSSTERPARANIPWSLAMKSWRRCRSGRIRCAASRRSAPRSAAEPGRELRSARRRNEPCYTSYAIGDLARVGRKRLRTPGDVSVRAHQNEPTFVQRGDLRSIDRDRLKGDAAPRKRLYERLAPRRAGEAEEDEPIPEEIERRAAVLEPGMRRARSRAGRRMILRDRIGNGLRPVIDDDGGVIIAVAERDPVGHVNARLLRFDPLAECSAGALARRRIVADLRRRLAIARRTVVLRRLPDVPFRDRPALEVVRIEQSGRRPSLQDRRELPAEIDDVTHPGVEPETAGRRVHMGRVAGQKHAAFTVAFGDEVARHPPPDREQLVRDRLPGHAAYHCVDVELAAAIEVLLATQSEAPQLPAVERDERPADAGRIDEAVQRGLPFVMILPQPRNAQEDADVVVERGIAVHRDSERLANLAPRARTIDQIVGGNRLPPLPTAIPQRRNDSAFALLERLEATTIANRHRWKAFGLPAQDRIEPDLVAALGTLGTVFTRLPHPVMRPLDARDEMSGQARQIENRVRKILRHPGLADGVGKAPTPQKLHRPCVECGRAGMEDRPVFLLDERAPDPAPTEIDRERKSDGAAAGDQHRRRLHRYSAIPA